MAKAKVGRMIFQPNILTDLLIRGVTESTNLGVSDVINDAVADYFTPKNKRLAAEIKPLLDKVLRDEDIPEEELQAILANCVEVLKDYPVGDYYWLEQIMYRFRTTSGNTLRYDYPLIVNTRDDAELHRLNEVLKTVDDSYNMGCHELGERTRTIFSHWEELAYYGEIYTQIATIIRNEHIYMPLTVYDTIGLVRDLDVSVSAHGISKIADKYDVKVSIRDRIAAKEYEILVYLADNGYVALTGDAAFEMPEEVREYYKDLHETIQDRRREDAAHYDEYYADLERLENKGRKLFVSLAREKNE